MLRIIVISDGDIPGFLKSMTAHGLLSEVLTDVEYMEHYGLSSRPMPGAIGLATETGTRVEVHATDDPRCRPQLAPGDTCLYDFRGRKILLGPLGASISGASAINLGDTIAGNLRRLIDERFIALFNAHVHPVGNANTGASTTQMDPADHATSIVRAT